MKALQVFAGPRARQQLLTSGLRPTDVRVIPAAAGGPKGLVLNPLDRFIFGHWLSTSSHKVHLIGASIGAWRMACASLNQPEAALAQMADDYIHQHYDHEPGKPPSASHVSQVLGAHFRQRFSGRESEVLLGPRYRLTVITSAGRGLLRREGRWRTPLGFAVAAAKNLISRRALGGSIERVLFSDTRDGLPFSTSDHRTHQVPLQADNLVLSLLATCSIPFWLKAVHDIPGAPVGAHWDGGLADYQLHLDYAAMQDGLVLFPHFQPQLIPGWLDKPLRHRHRSTGRLDNVVLLAPHPDWVATLPNRKLPDRRDFKAYGDDEVGRIRHWSVAVTASQQLADEFAALVDQPSIVAKPLV